MKMGKREAIVSKASTSAFVLFLVLLQCAPHHCFQQSVVPSRGITRPNRPYRSLLVDPSPKRQMRVDTSLSASTLLSAVGSPVGSVAVLASIILIHEAGHYLAAQSLGITVEEFSVGVGPKIFGFRAFGNEFNLRALPFGGFVRFPENYNSSAVMELQEAAMDRQVEVGDEGNSALSGLMNVLTLGRFERKRQEETLKKVQEEQSNSKSGSKIFGFSPKPKQEEAMPKSFDIEYYDDPNLLQNRPWPQRALVLSGGVIFNMLLAFCIFFGEIHNGRGLPKPVFDQGAVVSSLPSQESAANGILEPGDIIVSVNGSPLSMSKSPNAVAAQQAITDFINQIRATPEGQAMKLSVMKGNALSPVDVTVQPKRATDDFGNVGPQSIGVLLRPNFIKTEPIRSDSIPQAMSLAASSVAELTAEIANGLLAFFGQIASGKGAPPGQGISGPIGLIRTGSSFVSTNDLDKVLTFAAVISINLAVVNSLPLPALDGGQMLFVISEAITGRKVDQRLEEGINSVAIIFLLLLTFGTTIGDVESIFGR